MNIDGSGFLELSYFLQPDKFRLIPESLLNVPPGKGDIFVQIDLFSRTEKFFSVSEGEKITNVFNTMYGYARNNANLDEIFARLALDNDRDKRIRLRYSDDRYLMIFDSRTGKPVKEELVFSARNNEVDALLEQCLKPNNDVDV